MLKTKKRSFNFFKETQEGIKATIPYLFSHHKPEHYNKCFIVFGTAICSRCSGIYLGIFLGFLIYLANYLYSLPYLLIILLFPLFALTEWTISTFKIYKSNNYARFTTGILLGVAYSFGLILLFTSFPNIPVIVIGLIYGTIAIMLVILKNKSF